MPPLALPPPTQRPPPPALITKHPRSFHISAAALALFWVAGLLGPGHVAVNAQQPQPLAGQNIDPKTAGVINTSVPVYTSVSLEKLQEIDEKGYTFSAVFTVVMTWNQDSRINQTVNLINFLGSDAKATQNQKLANCTKWATFTGGTSNPDCTDALSATSKDCTRTCFMGNGYACCDNVWIPGFHIANILEVKQDAMTTDEVWLYGTAVGDKTQDWGAVYRVVRVQALFSNEYDFRKFPFDKQLLTFQMSPIPPANHYIVPSVIGKSVLGPYGYVFQSDARAFATAAISNQGGTAKFSTEIGTGWAFNEGNAVEMVCNSANTPPAPPTNNSLPATDDPQYYAYTNLKNASTGQTQAGLTCSVCVKVVRTYRYYVFNTIIPVVVNSLLAFTVVFARPSDLDIRLSTLVTLFLALVAVQFVISDQLPRTSYVTAFAALLMLSYCLIVVLILESLFVFYLSVVLENYNRKKQAQQRRMTIVHRRNSTTPRIERVQEDDEDAGGGPPPEDEIEEGEDGETYRGLKRGPNTPYFRPFMYTEETVMRLFLDENDAFRIATIVDNVSLLLLGIAYVTGGILLFVLNPTSSQDCVV